MGPLEDPTGPWNPRDVGGLPPLPAAGLGQRLCVDEATGDLQKQRSRPRDEAVERLLHRTIAKVGGDIDRLAFNTAIAAMIEFVNCGHLVRWPHGPTR